MQACEAACRTHNIPMPLTSMFVHSRGRTKKQRFTLTGDVDVINRVSVLLTRDPAVIPGNDQRFPNNGRPGRRESRSYRPRPIRVCTLSGSGP